MKKRISFSISIILCLLALAGCTCKHIWVEADCATAKRCSSCGKTKGEPLGHTWVDATCVNPKTCSACSATEGQSLAHSEAVRNCAIDYKTLTMEQQTYCTSCEQILSSGEIILDTLHDDSHFLLDSKGFLERYTKIEAQLEDNPFFLPDFDFSVVEITDDTLALDLYDQYGYSLRISFTFRELTDGSAADPIRRCTGIVADPAASAELGDPDPNGMLDSAESPGEKAETDRLNGLANTVALNGLMFRNIMLGFMVLDPTLETNAPGDEAWTVLLDILDVLNGENPGFVLNDIRYYANENDELVMEVAS